MSDAGAQWFEYDWKLDGHMAHIAVDMALVNRRGAGFDTLVYLSCRTKRKSAPLNSLECSAIESLCKKIEKKLAPLYAGFVETASKRQLYFYCADASAKEAIESAAKGNLFLECRVGVASEPDWVTYNALLYPDAAKLQTERNRERIDLMKKNGDGITSTRRVTFSLFFATEAIMLLFAEQARLSGFAVAGSAFEPDFELAYGARIVKLSSLRKAEIDELTTRAIRIAETFSGELRYWDAPIVRRGGPLMGN